MNIMSLDCEFMQPSGNTIEIGAAIYKVVSGELVGTFHTYVNPNEPLSEFITELTGITEDKVINAPQIKEAFKSLHQFHKKNKALRNPCVWGSGVRNDSSTIYEQSGISEENFMGFRVIDAKTIYQSIQIFRNSTIKGGLLNCCNKLGIGWDDKFGPPHRALADAHNTFRVWHFMMSKIYTQFPKK